MKSEEFLKHFGTLAQGPNGIRNLRRLVLDLAVRGRMTSYNKNDVSVEKLLDNIHKKKEHFLAKGVVPKSRIKPLAPPEQPFNLPLHWKWVKLDDIAAYIQRGKGPKYAHKSNVPIISQKCVQWHGFDLSRARFLDEDVLPKYGRERFLQSGDLLWNSTGTGTIGRINIFPGSSEFRRTVADSHVTVVRLIEILPEYVWCFLASPIIQDTIEGDAPGSTNQVELSTGKVKAMLVPLPPLAEQKRIVAKVDELMALCDELEEKQNSQTELRCKTVQAVLAALVTSNSAQNQQKIWSILSEHWDDWFSDVEAISKLRAAIFDLAINGKLGTQNDTDVSVRCLLAKMVEKKQHLIDSKIIKKPKPLQTIAPDNHPFKPPQGWRWVRLGELIKSIEYGTSEKATANKRGGVPVYAMGHIQDGRLIDRPFKYLEKKSKSLPKLHLKNRDILFNRTNSYDLVGKSAVYHGADDKFTFASYLIRISLLHEFSECSYINIYLNSSICRKTQIEPEITNQTNQANFNGTKLKNILVPFPPMEEQKRIVARVKELMSLCDQLENQVIETEKQNEAFLQAISHHFVNSTAHAPALPKSSEEISSPNATFDVTVPERVADIKPPAARASSLKTATNPIKTTKSSEKFKEAVLVGAIVQAFFDVGGEPLGNFRIQKGVYFARRHMGEKALEQEFLRKAAGPYNPSMKYSGGIKIAKDKGYIREARGRFGFGHISGDNIDELMTYADRYGDFKEAAQWVCRTFRFEKNEEWELLATIDYALMHFASIGIHADAAQIMDYIQADDEWSAKIDKLKLTEEKINRAMEKTAALFKDTS